MESKEHDLCDLIPCDITPDSLNIYNDFLIAILSITPAPILIILFIIIGSHMK